jgi:hypothetical protein
MKKAALLFLLLIFLPVANAYPWGGVNFWCPTHQLILKEAYGLLSKDPAFQGSGFLSLNSIAAHEGVNLRDDFILDFTGVGPGPDAEGATPYSWHYYNPLTKKGKGPSAVQAYYKILANRNNQGNKAKATAWGAHFLADMSVPYHIVGTPRDEALYNLANKKRYLSDTIAGPSYLYDNEARGLQPPLGWGGRNDFWNALVNYAYNHAEGNADWFDPWYSNATGLFNSHETGRSSHVEWEKRAHKIYSGHPHFHSGIFPDGDGRYNPAWKNSQPNYGFNINVAEAQSQQAAYFAHAAAMYTRNQMHYIHESPGIGIDHAIRNVATLWRSSITGLRPMIYYYANVTNDPSTYEFECRITNVADAPAQNIKVKLFVLENNKVVYSNQQNGGYIKARAIGSVRFRVKMPPGKKYVIAMAVCAKYNIPDFQFATCEGTFATRPKTGQPQTGQRDLSNNIVRKSWEGSWRIRSKHTGGKFKGASVVSTLRVYFDKNNRPSVTFNGIRAKVLSLSKTTLVYKCNAGGNTVTTTLNKQKNGYIKGFFNGKHNASGQSVSGNYYSAR